MKRIKFLFAWYDLWFGFFWDKKKKWLYFLPVPTVGIIIKFDLFSNWMDELKAIAIKDMPRDYKEGNKWCDEYFKKRYYDNGFSPENAWRDYTTMVR